MDTQIKTQAAAVKQNQDNEQAFIDYLIWSLAHEQDPHNQYDDPIAVFRCESRKDAA
ncbi:hypothetical protein [Alkalimarinus sediminis]|uniref:Uncharacterized protein n=1 Tax=Alkalimarinus sediminis TaxID=1632866 RepID=A0A9E8KMH9_9ALTE|nr:hypothetical protein [Alkalimarinus sediminis]UZW73448.1 hypothetical protein NNL22_10335 [Alkalimarinus sediminis]